MRKLYDLSTLDWRLAGYSPERWRWASTLEVRTSLTSEVAAIPARVPGSVQGALRAAGELPDWNVGLDARACEWVENRQWIYQATLPAAWQKGGTSCRLVCLGLDYSGWVLVNGEDVGAFRGSLVTHTFDLTPHLRPGADNLLQIAFDLPPRWLGQFGETSKMREWKPRFNYTWDWVSRLVQIGIWDDILLEVSDGRELRSLRCTADADLTTGQGILHLAGEASGAADGTIDLSLQGPAGVLAERRVDAATFARGFEWRNLPVDLWWPNGQGQQPLYTLRCLLLDAAGQEMDRLERTVGFRHIEWQSCAGAPAGADPWLCVVNGKPVFLQGVNWSPIRPNFADVSEDDYRLRVQLYHDLGCNTFRVWGGSYPEKECFYRLCDELGMLVWQEFPLSSSGSENWPPEDAQSIADLAEIAASYIRRKQHHASLLLWCGGNELQGDLQGGKAGTGKPVDCSHPLIGRLAQVVSELDSGRRFLPTSSSGPRFTADKSEFGRGLHWDVHGPWQVEASMEEWRTYWQNDDALFRSETGAPGASPVDITRALKGSLPEMPGTLDNPLWRRNSWWIEWPVFVREKGREPADLEEYVSWSQARQAEALTVALSAAKGRFPRCGGMLFWMGHDCFPCAANTAIVDFYGRPKPAAIALSKIWRK